MSESENNFTAEELLRQIEETFERTSEFYRSKKYNKSLASEEEKLEVKNFENETLGKAENLNALTFTKNVYFENNSFKGLTKADALSKAQSNEINPDSNYFNESSSSTVSNYGSNLNLRQILFFSPEIAPWYNEVLDSISEWTKVSESTDPDSKESVASGIFAGTETITSNLEFLSTTLASLTSNSSLKKYIRIVSGNNKTLNTGSYKTIQFDSKGRPNEGTTEDLKKDTKSYIDLTKKPTLDLDSLYGRNLTQPIVQQALQALTYTSQKDKYAFDNCYDLFLTYQNQENVWDDTTTSLFKVRATDIAIPGKAFGTTEVAYKSGLRMLKPNNKIIQEKKKSVSFVLDQGFKLLKKIYNESGFIHYDFVESNRDLFENIVVQNEVRKDLYVVLYKGLGSFSNNNSVIDALKRTTTPKLYCFESVRFLGFNSNLTLKAVDGGEVAVLQTPFIYRRGYWVE